MAEQLRTSGSTLLPLTAQVPVPLGHPRAPGAPFLLQMILDVSLQITAPNRQEKLISSKKAAHSLCLWQLAPREAR